MRRGDVDAGRAAQFADGEAERGRGLDAVEQIGFDAVAGEHLGYAAHELIGPVAGVTAERDRRVLKGAVKVIRKTLRSLADGIDVQPVGAETELATQAAGAKLKIAKKRICLSRLIQCKELSLIGACHTRQPFIKSKLYLISYQFNSSCIFGVHN